MSFMRLQGHKYHCTQCKKAVTVEYQGGLQRTMVSGPVIESQAALVKKLRLRSHDRATYFHEEGLCESCEKRVSAEGLDDIATPEQSEQFHAAIHRLMAAAERHEKKLHALVAGWLVRWVGSMDLDSLRKFAPREFEETLARAPQTAPFDREKLVRDYLDATRKVIEERGLAALAEDSTARAAVRRYEKNTPGLVASARKALAACGSYRYSPVSIRRAVSLNPYLESRHSVRIPVETTRDSQFYLRCPLDRERAESEIRKAEALIGVALPANDLNSKVMLRIFELVHFPA